jgi:Planctomycete cytochrome C
MSKIFHKIYIGIIAASIVFLAQSCDDTLTSSEVDKIVMPDSNVSYSAHIAPVFEVKCVPCHNNSGRKEAGLDLSSWSGITADPSIVARGSDSTSILVWTIEGLPPYPLMPPSGRMIENHIQGIRTWIREGALYN